MAYRLEPRKGLRVFVDALNLLDAGKLDPRFEVLFLGGSAYVDGQESLPWLETQSKQWPWPTRILPSAAPLLLWPPAWGLYAKH